jgi:hypothetical protein
VRSRSTQFRHTRSINAAILSTGPVPTDVFHVPIYSICVRRRHRTEKIMHDWSRFDRSPGMIVYEWNVDCLRRMLVCLPVRLVRVVSMYGDTARPTAPGEDVELHVVLLL